MHEPVRVGRAERSLPGYRAGNADNHCQHHYPDSRRYSIPAVLAEAQTHIVTAEAERVVQRVARRALLGSVGDEVEIEAFIGMFEIDRWRHHVVMHGEGSGDRFDSAGSAQ